jgi:hypothetical protein
MVSQRTADAPAAEKSPASAPKIMLPYPGLPWPANRVGRLLAVSATTIFWACRDNGTATPQQYPSSEPVIMR